MSNDLKQNLERYKNCFCNKGGGDPVVKLLGFSSEKRGTVHILRPEILFMVKGEAHVSMLGIGASRRLGKGEFIYLPTGTHLACDIAKDSVMLVLHVAGELPECPVFSMNRSAENVNRHKESEGIYALKANRRIRNLIAELIETVQDGFLCRHFLEGEANRLLFLLHAYYSEEERVKFFSHVLTPDIKFSEFVRLNHMNYKCITDIASALYMTPQSFSSRFKKVFGMPPHKWMQQEKARRIYLDVCRSDMPLKEIAAKYDFPQLSNFFRFCKQTFGESPGRIRKHLHNDTAKL